VIIGIIGRCGAYADVGGETLGPVAGQFGDDGQVVEFRLQRRERFVIGARHCLVEFQQMRQQLPQLLPFHRFHQRDGHELF